MLQFAAAAKQVQRDAADSDLYRLAPACPQQSVCAPPAAAHRCPLQPAGILNGDMLRTRLVAAAVLLGWCVVVPSAQRVDPARRAIDTYRVAIQRAQKAPERGQLEAAFNAIEPLRQALVIGRDGSNSALEALSEPEFSQLRGELIGLVVNREEAVFVEPDVAFFQALAARGEPADRAFFSALSATFPESVWPVYVEQQTDYSGCTRFGSGTLVATYLTWSVFRQQYPKRYEDASGTHLDDVKRALTESTCACGDRASVEKELTEFLRRAKVSELRTEVAARLAAVRSARAKFRFACTSG